MKTTFLACATILFAVAAHAAEGTITPSERVFSPEEWQTGFHFFPAIGANSSLFSSQIEGVKGGAGVTLRTDLGYYFHNDTALELSTSVAFNRINGLLIWDTIFAFGYRTRIPFFTYDQTSAPYLRLFAGASPAVVVFEGERQSPYKELGAQRLQWEGPVGGAGVGVFRKHENGPTWFVEATLTFHSFRKEEIIKSEGEVPVVVARAPEDDGEHLINFHLILGLAAF